MKWGDKYPLQTMLLKVFGMQIFFTNFLQRITSHVFSHTVSVTNKQFSGGLLKRTGGGLSHLIGPGQNLGIEWGGGETLRISAYYCI